jgi:hypothetical protein
LCARKADALIGGLSAELGGGSFATGAEGAGSAEASRNLLKNLPPDLQQWGSAVIGTATAKVTGNNNSTTGAATAIAGTANNDLAHRATGIAKGVIDGLKNDAQGLWNMFANFDETIDGIKNATGTIYDLGKEQGFRAVFKEIATAVGGDWVSQYDKINIDFANGNIDENTYDYRVGILSGEVAYFMATTIPAPEKLSLSPKLVSALGKISKAKDFELPPVVVTADRIKKVEYGDQYTKVNGKKSLKSNVKYTTTEGYKYVTDDNGRISSVEANLELGKADRNKYAQKTVGGEDRLPKDDGGHLIASIFKGSGELDNLVPMNSTLNRSEYKILENTWKNALKEGKEVAIKVKPIYEKDSMRPAQFRVDYSINGEKYKAELPNYKE